MFEGIQDAFLKRQGKLTEGQKRELQNGSKVFASEWNKELGDFVEGVRTEGANSFVGIQLRQLLFEEEGETKGEEEVGVGVPLEEVRRLCEANIENLGSLMFI